jgi:UDP-N-acetylmuramyl pentapeptide phosphotransferase/UDP-N-acetylglucosamine-1-phosphate transferase
MTAIALASGLALATAMALSAGLIVLLFPLLQRYALARPNARSSHRIPTPQGGGIAIIAATLLVAGAAIAITSVFGSVSPELAAVAACTAILAVIGAVDDIRPLEAIPRLVLQALVVMALVAVLPATLRVVPFLPWWIERALMVLALVWLVNLTNFMDGIDWITVAEVVPVTAALGMFGLLGALPGDATLIAFALCGATLGFAPFNRPAARLFMGDVGSLPIGLLLGWLLIHLAEHHFAAALLLPLYYLADATITLLRRWRNSEALMTSHRSHFYQRALDGGMPVMTIIRHVVVLNVGLAGLAFATWLAPAVSVPAVLCGAALVGYVLFSFDRYAGSVARRRANSAD